MEFEEYRQPWETGPHWELKREFLEFYQDNFAKDRLLCLAQAYSNIELMQCSYPNQVMFQIHELSKPLKANKRFRSSLSSNNESAQKQKGKRKLDDDSDKKYKFIKFCSSTQDHISPKKEKTESPAPVSSSNVDFKSIINSPDFDVIEKIALEVKKIQVSNKTKMLNAIIQAAKKFNVEHLFHTKFNSTIVHGCLQTYCELFINETAISRGNGPCEDTAKLKAAENALQILKNLHKHSNPHKPLNNLEAKEHGTEVQIEVSGAEQQISFNHAQNSSEFYEFGTLSTEHLDFLKKFAENFKNTQKKIPNDLEALQLTSNRLKLKNGIECNVSTDMDSPEHNRTFSSELLINNIPVARGKGSSKKNARLNVAKAGIRYLFSLIDCDGVYYFGEIDPNRAPLQIDTMFKDQSQIKTQEVSDPGTHCENVCSNDDIKGHAYHVQSKKPFLLNDKLWRNSLNRQIVLVDRTGVIDPTFNNPASKLSFSAQLSRKQISYLQEAVDGDKWRCEVMIDKEVVGTACSFSKVTAKAEACSNALETLRKEVYTVKMKMGEEDGFFINRHDMVQLKNDGHGRGSQGSGSSAAVSESNIGCKMLKMMGWSGGGIGKNEGIIEPISAGNHSFGRGLGFVKNDGDADIMSLRPKITALLKEYSQSNALVPLVFAADFTKEERKLIHNIASKFHLSSASHGKKEARRVSVKRKVSVRELLHLILESGGSNKTYELVDMSMESAQPQL